MNTVQRFFRRYILSTVGIVLFIFCRQHRFALCNHHCRGHEWG